MQVLIGTSGFSYPAWRGGFYPEKLPETKMLGYYAGHFRAVEINNSFYRMPTAELLGRWAGETPPEFRFALKSPRRITHDKRLLDTASAVERLTEASRALGRQAGPGPVSAPAQHEEGPRRGSTISWRRCRPGCAATVEFRHESWFSDDVYGCLRTRQAALCIAESDDFVTPLEATADWGYLRLRREDYDDALVASWGARIKTQGWSTAYVFFKHEDTGKGPVAAARLHELMAA